MSLIDVKHLSFAYEKNKKVLDDLSASFEKGRIIALIGKNGSGKTTFLDCLLGINEYQGEITFDGKDIKGMSNKEFSRLVSFIPQSVNTNIDYNIRDFISFGRNPHLNLLSSLTAKDYEIVEKNAEKCGIASFLGKNINSVSGGERQLVYIARALSQETPIIIMDEPTASLDFGNQQKLFRIMQSLAKEGKTIVFTTHNPNHLVNLECDIFAVKNGQLSKIDELNRATIKEIYDNDFDMEGKAFIFRL